MHHKQIRIMAIFGCSRIWERTILETDGPNRLWILSPKKSILDLRTLISTKQVTLDLRNHPFFRFISWVLLDLGKIFLCTKSAKGQGGNKYAKWYCASFYCSNLWLYLSDFVLVLLMRSTLKFGFFWFHDRIIIFFFY